MKPNTTKGLPPRRRKHSRVLPQNKTRSCGNTFHGALVFTGEPGRPFPGKSLTQTQERPNEGSCGNAVLATSSLLGNHEDLPGEIFNPGEPPAICWFPGLSGQTGAAMVLAYCGSASALAHRLCLPGNIITFLPPSPRLATRLLPEHGKTGRQDRAAGQGGRAGRQGRAAGRYVAILASRHGCPGNGPGVGWGWGWKALKILS